MCEIVYNILITNFTVHRCIIRSNAPSNLQMQPLGCIFVYALNCITFGTAIDPSYGSGGFLVETLRYIWNKLDEEGKKYNWNATNLREEKMEVALNKICGIDKDYFLSKVCKAYMAILGDGKSGIFCEDSLDDPNNWHEKTRIKVAKDKFSILLTNPPFGSKIPVRGEDKLKQFELGYKWKLNRT